MEKRIAKNSGNAAVLRVEAPADTPLGIIWKMLRVVAPPGTVVVPEMVERVVRDPYGECVCVHGNVSAFEVETSGTRAIKKRPPVRKGAYQSRRDFCSADFSRCTSVNFR